jgi:hypothetical protein
MPETIHGLFDNALGAQECAAELISRGVRQDDVSLVLDQRRVDPTTGAPRDAKAAETRQLLAAIPGYPTNTDERPGDRDILAHTLDGAAIGLGLGGVESISWFFFPGAGWVIFGVAALTFIVGTALGAWWGSRTEAYAPPAARGSAVLAVDVGSDAARIDQIRNLMRQYGAIEVGSAKPTRASTTQPVIRPNNVPRSSPT